MHAVRNLRFCTKDCVCLFVCPTKATDTENGQIDASKCLDGCRLCVDTCPSHAISLTMETWVEPAPKAEAVAEKFFALLDRKASEEAAVKKVKKGGQTPILKALAKSLRIVAEDAAREAAYMLPQSKATRALIDRLLEERPQVAQKPFPEEELKELRELM